MMKRKKGFSVVELVVVVGIMAVLMAILAPALLTYTERSRAQKDISTMDEVVNAVQLAIADSDCYDEMLAYSCTNNYTTYTDSSGNLGQTIIDEEYWAPDGYGHGVTITFHPIQSSNGDVYYSLDTAILNDMTYDNGSTAQDRIMEGNEIAVNQCYLKNAQAEGLQSGLLYNRVRQIVGDTVFTTSATYQNSSYTVFISFHQKDGVTTTDVSGSFNGTNLHEGCHASLGSGIYDEVVPDDDPDPALPPNTSKPVYDSTSLQGSGSLSGMPDYKQNETEKEEEEKFVELHHSGTIPEGGKFVRSGVTYLPGDPFPEGCKYNDKYYFGDYVYAYSNSNPGWKASLNTEVTDKTKTSYGPLLWSINDVSLGSVYGLFQDCSNLETSPVIPMCVQNMGRAYYKCYALRQGPVFPTALTSLYETFYYCEALESVQGEIPDAVNTMYQTFNKCVKLTYCPPIPSACTSFRGAFFGCASLENAPDMSKATQITNTVNAFKNCSNMKTGPVINGNALVEADSMFWGCSSMEIAPQLPSSVTSATCVFNECTSLKTYYGNPNGDGDFSAYVLPNADDFNSFFSKCYGITKAPAVIPDTAVELSWTFSSCKNMVVGPTTIPESVTDMRGTFSGCTALTTVGAIPSSVDLMTDTFRSCKALAGTITINANPSSWTAALFQTKVTAIDGATSIKENFMCTISTYRTNPTPES